MCEKPVILISPAHDIDAVRHREEFCINEGYALAVIGAGGIPVLPGDSRNIEDYVELADGLILTGGWPLSVENITNGILTPQYMDRFIKEEREPFELALYQKFRDAGKPIIGICYGHQCINMGQGGNLEYNIAKAYQAEHRGGVSHKVTAEPGSLLYELYGKEFMVNSFHGYAIADLGKDLKITAWSDEGIPEAIEHVSLPIYGFQWHPERMRGETPTPPDGPDMEKMFQRFMNLCMSIRESQGKK